MFPLPICYPWYQRSDHHEKLRESGAEHEEPLCTTVVRVECFVYFSGEERSFMANVLANTQHVIIKGAATYQYLDLVGPSIRLHQSLMFAK